MAMATVMLSCPPLSFASSISLSTISSADPSLKKPFPRYSRDFRFLLILELDLLTKFAKYVP